MVLGAQRESVLTAAERRSYAADFLLLTRLRCSGGTCCICSRVGCPLAFERSRGVVCDLVVRVLPVGDLGLAAISGGRSSISSFATRCGLWRSGRIVVVLLDSVRYGEVLVALIVIEALFSVRSGERGICARAQLHAGCHRERSGDAVGER